MKILIAAVLMTSIVSSIAQAAPAKAKSIVMECGYITTSGEVAGKMYIVTIEGQKGFIKRKFGMGVGPSKPQNPKGEEHAASIAKMNRLAALPINPDMKPGLVDGYKLESYQDNEETLRVAVKKETSGKYKGKQLGFKTFRGDKGDAGMQGMYCE